MSYAPVSKVYPRETVRAMLRAAIAQGEHRFARRLALAWLAAFPGDMEMTLLQAQSMLVDGKPGQVIAALELVLRKDPFYLDAYRLMAQAAEGVDPSRFLNAAHAIYALNSAFRAGFQPAPWGSTLRQTVEAVTEGRFQAADQHVQEVIRLQPDLLLPAALHLRIHRETEPAAAVDHLARLYHARWPDCLPVSLILAESRLELGDEPEAVRLLHQCAASDATGQSARLLWGEDHPYRSLWPEDMVIPFDQPIPAAVAAFLGWNFLAPGEIRAVPVSVSSAVEPEETVSDSGAEQTPEPVEPMPTAPAAQTTESNSTTVLPQSSEIRLQTEGITGAPAVNTQPEQVVSPPDASAQQNDASRKTGDKSRAANKPTTTISETARAVESELERLSKKVKSPASGRVDGRFPTYVIFSCKQGLIDQYGPQTTIVLDGDLRKLAGMIRQHHGWNAIVYYPDDPGCAEQYGHRPVKTRDPWKLKHALADLDRALGKRGERIGALLIVGGDEVVPFHRLPNPTDDADSEVISDSPYATLDANYFVPEWPVGRLPGESGPDACLLLEQLRQLHRYHTKRAQSSVFLGFEWINWMKSIFERFLPTSPASSFGYTAAAWRRSSLAVFRPVGDPHAVLASPPEQAGNFVNEKVVGSSLGYYNLHGLEDSPFWYGQRDPAEKGSATDYPVALSPQDLRRNGHAPRIVFSEACYGGHVFGKNAAASLGLKFLSMGTLAVIASTSISYGSINTPLIAADLLGNMFWQHMKSGGTAGEALLQAKVDLVREMERRQGYLDGEDQKTLISFVLYGDPLAAYDGFRVKSKAAPRPKDHSIIKLVCDSPHEESSPAHLSKEALKQVKQIVADYLPGADLSDLHLSRQHAVCTDVRCPNYGQPCERHAFLTEAAQSKRGAKSGDGRSMNGRVVVTVSKQVTVAEHLHKQYVRVTLDEGGRPVKMSLSR